jgi:hypothetical protein
MSAGLRRQQQQQQLNGVQPVRELSSQPASHALAAIVEPPIIPCPVPLSTAGATRSRQATNPERRTQYSPSPCAAYSAPSYPYAHIEARVPPRMGIEVLRA